MDSEVRINVTEARRGEEDCIEIGGRSPVNPTEATRMAQDLLAASDQAVVLLHDAELSPLVGTDGG